MYLLPSFIYFLQVLLFAKGLSYFRNPLFKFCILNEFKKNPNSFKLNNSLPILIDNFKNVIATKTDVDRNFKIKKLNT